MSALVVDCPKTGQRIFTGIEIESEDLRRLPEIRARVECPACGGVHAWTRAGAYLFPETGPMRIAVGHVERYPAALAGVYAEAEIAGQTPAPLSIFKAVRA